MVGFEVILAIVALAFVAYDHLRPATRRGYNALRQWLTKHRSSLPDSNQYMRTFLSRPRLVVIDIQSPHLDLQTLRSETLNLFLNRDDYDPPTSHGHPDQLQLSLKDIFLDIFQNKLIMKNVELRNKATDIASWDENRSHLDRISYNCKGGRLIFWLCGIEEPNGYKPTVNAAATAGCLECQQRLPSNGDFVTNNRFHNSALPKSRDEELQYLRTWPESEFVNVYSKMKPIISVTGKSTIQIMERKEKKVEKPWIYEIEVEVTAYRGERKAIGIGIVSRKRVEKDKGRPRNSWKVGVGDRLGMVLDAAQGKLGFTVNGVVMGEPLDLRNAKIGLSPVLAFRGPSQLRIDKFGWTWPRPPIHPFITGSSIEVIFRWWCTARDTPCTTYVRPYYSTAAKQLRPTMDGWPWIDEVEDYLNQISLAGYILWSSWLYFVAFCNGFRFVLVLKLFCGLECHHVELSFYWIYSSFLEIFCKKKKELDLLYWHGHLSYAGIRCLFLSASFNFLHVSNK